MKQIRFILLALVLTLGLIACERPAPTGDIATPNPDIIPREAYPALQPTETAVPTDTTTPTDGSGQTTDGEAAAGGETTGSTDATEQPVEAAATNAPPALEDGVYVVRAGDTLGRVAAFYGVSIADLMAANNLPNPDVLTVGQQLTIPEAGFADSQPETDPSAAETPETTEGEETIHVVQPGDNLYRIGLRYGFTIDELAEYNGITNVNSLEVGQQIKIPPRN